MDLKSIIKHKKTRLCFSADFTLKKDLFHWIHKLGDSICILKTHIDILEDFDESVIDELNTLKRKYNFLILEDRKFSDIGKTFLRQLHGGIYKIASWADLVTIHGITCEGMLNVLTKESPKVVIVAQMSSSNNLISEDYTRRCYDIALRFRDKVLGFISQKRFIEDKAFLFLTPGVHFKECRIKDQNYRTIQKAIFEDKNDIVIMGSAIYSDTSFDIKNIKFDLF